MATALIPLGYYFVLPDRFMVLMMLAILILFSVFIEIYRGKPRSGVEYIFSNFLNPLLRPDELDGELTGATWNFLAHLLVILIFPIEIAVVSLLIMTVGDATAGLSGKIIGKIKIFSKTLEGFAVGVAACIPIIFLFPTMSTVVITIGITTGMIVELLPLPINDNFSIPLVAGGSMMLTGYFL